MLNIPRDARNRFPPSGALLIVSPHFDDAALSCSALLDRGEPVDVLTVFSGAPEPPRQGWWDERCGFASSAESVPARRREDENALEPGGHHLHLLDLLEVQHFDGPRGAEDAVLIADFVRDWLVEMNGGAVALPAGAGWAPHWLPPRVAKKLREPRGPEPHHDHLFVRDAVLGAVIDDARFVLYEELPYLWGGSAARAARGTARAHGYRAQREIIPVDRERKARRLAAYTSQIAHISPPEGRLDSPATLPPSERYWLLRRR
jgi:LmbE family N-acetylglucosaminyl deacetylase